MKSYLELINLSHKYDKSKNRTTIFTIIIAICLVVSIISLADLVLDLLVNQEKKESGDFHVQIENYELETIDILERNPKINSIGKITGIDTGLKVETRKDVDNSSLKSIIGLNNEYLEQSNINIIEGRLLNTNSEIVLHSSQIENGFELGDKITVYYENKKLLFEVVGFYDSISGLETWDGSSLISSFDIINEISGLENIPYITLQFNDRINIRKEVDNIIDLTNINKDQVKYNENLLIYLGQSDNIFVLEVYGIAFILLILVLITSTLMIYNNFNINVQNKKRFYGLLRCMGATRKQIKKYVVMGGIYLSIISIPLGSLIGVIATIGFGHILKLIIPEYFVGVNIIRVCIPAIIVGAVVAIITVILSTLIPSRDASKVSPLIALSVNHKDDGTSNTQVKKVLGNIDFTMGVNNAISNKKNLISISLSFALILIIFLSLTVFIDFMEVALTPLHPLMPDIEINSLDNDLYKNTIDELDSIEGVKSIYGRSYSQVDCTINGEAHKLDLISLDTKQSELLKNDLKKGEILTDHQNNNKALFYSAFTELKIDDTVNIGEKEVNIEGIFSKSPYTDATDDTIIGTMFVLDDLFFEITGIDGYMVIDLQVSNLEASRVMNNVRAKYVNNDEVTIGYLKDSNNQIKYMTTAAKSIIYSFILIILFIGSLNIYNSVSISFIKKMNVLGTMRAIGTTVNQIKNMFMYETFIYALSGNLIGTIIGVWLHRKIYYSLIYSKYSIAWHIPIKSLIFLYFSVFLVSFLSTIIPIKRFQSMSIIEIIDE